MVGWIILGVLIGLIVLLLLIPVGADFRYEDEVIRLSLKIAGFKLQLIPKPKKKKKPKKEKPPKEKKEKEPKPEKEEEKSKKKFSLPFNLEEIMQLLEVLLHRLGELPLKMKVERFVLHWIATGQDPYLTARFFGVINAGLSQLAPIYAVRYPCRNSSVWTDIDFTRDNSFFECGLTATIRIGQALWSGLVIAFDVLKIYLKSRRRKKREKKEEEKALEKWLQEHPEDAKLLDEETKDETKTDETEVESQIA